MRRQGRVYKFDVSIPLNIMYSLVEDIRARVGHLGATVGFGHLGDSNLHLNVITTKEDPAVEALIVPYIYDWIGMVLVVFSFFTSF